MKNILVLHIKKMKFAILFLFIIQFFYILISSLIPIINGKFINILSENKMTTMYLIKFAILIFVLGFSTLILNYFYSVLLVKYKNKLSLLIFKSQLKKLYCLPFEKIIQYTKGYLVKRINEDSDILSSFFFNSFMPFLTNFAQILILLIIIFLLNYNIFFIMIIFIPIYISMYIYMKKPLFIFGKKYREAANTFFSKETENISMIKEVKIHSEIDEALSDLDNSYNIFFNSFMPFAKIQAKYTSIDTLIRIIFQLFVLIIGGFLVMNKQISIGEYTILNTYFSMCLTCIKTLLSIGQNYQEACVSSDRINEFLEFKNEQNGIIEIQNIERITISNLTFKHSKKDIIPIISNLNYKLTNKNIYLIIGKNGAGKTTLINLVSYLYQRYDTGDITINNIPIADLNMYKLRKKNMSFIIQNEYIPPIMVSDYLCLSSESNSWITNTPEFTNMFYSKHFNINNILNESIATLSGGQKQLVLLYKTLSKKADVYLLDEPNNELSQSMITNLFNLLNKLKQHSIIIIVTHDKTLEKLSNNIIFLN